MIWLFLFQNDFCMNYRQLTFCLVIAYCHWQSGIMCELPLEITEGPFEILNWTHSFILQIELKKGYIFHFNLSDI